MKYQNIIFDFGNVLVKFDEQQVIGRFCPAPEDFPLMKRAIFHNWDELDRGTIDYGEYMAQAASLLPKRLHPSYRFPGLSLPGQGFVQPAFLFPPILIYRIPGRSLPFLHFPE